MVQYLKNKADFDMLVGNETKLIVIDFTASWCPPCRMIAPIFEEMAEENPDVVFVKVDVDEADDVASACGISAMPTFQFYKGGDKVHEFSGASEQILRAKVAELK
ncbi:hypothetical protein CTEN210_13938 [Chaetoceros tenuissimus]|uniref:Thioredoxin n=1 Tax=Chaetoceros tenuissimus TaxID=426638 RepID=A0AAD3D3Z1_9STRA|nr:hypothetical protein CTEN210_13938 [Chaetoceros tenuissimus]